MILPLLIAAGAVGAYFAFVRKFPPATPPPGVSGTPVRREVTASSGNEYWTDQWAPDTKNDVYVVAYAKPNHAVRVGYYHNRTTSKKRIYVISAPDSLSTRAADIATIRRDFGV